GGGGGEVMGGNRKRERKGGEKGRRDDFGRPAMKRVAVTFTPRGSAVRVRHRPPVFAVAWRNDRLPRDGQRSLLANIAPRHMTKGALAMILPKAFSDTASRPPPPPPT